MCKKILCSDEINLSDAVESEKINSGNKVQFNCNDSFLFGKFRLSEDEKKFNITLDNGCAIFYNEMEVKNYTFNYNLNSISYIWA